MYMTDASSHEENLVYQKAYNAHITDRFKPGGGYYLEEF
jgi:hypothetical protein